MRHFLTIAALLAAFAFLERQAAWPGPYGYDEADYMYAASRGFWSNYTDTPGQSIVEFLRIGLKRGLDRTQARSLSEYIRNSGDIDFYHHWHGQLYFDWLIATGRWRGDERLMRTLSGVFPALGALIIYLGMLWIFDDPLRWPAAALSSGLYLSSYTVVTSDEIAPHQLFAVCALAALILLGKWVVSRDRRWWYGAVCASALAFCTLEIVFVLIFVVAVAGYWGWRNKLLTRSELLLRSPAVFALTVLVVWPAAIFKLAFIKGYMFMAFTAAVRNSWEQVSLAQAWFSRFRHAPVEWLLLLASLILIFRFRSSQAWYVGRWFLLYCGLMLAMLLRVNSTDSRYLLPLMPVWYVFAGLMVACAVVQLRPLPRGAVTALLIALLFWSTERQLRIPRTPDPRARELLAELRAMGLEDKRLLAPLQDVPVIHYYFPQTELRGYAELSVASTAIADKDVDAVVLPGYPVRIDRVEFRKQ